MKKGVFDTPPPRHTVQAMPGLLENLSLRDDHGLYIDGVFVSWGEMWRMAGRASGYVLDAGRNIACVMNNSHVAVASLVGGMRAGVKAASLPLPHRGQDLVEYAQYVRSVLEQLDAPLVACPSEMLELLDEFGVDAVSFDAVCMGDGSPGRPGGVLVQFSSGSTGSPKGVVLTMQQMEANLAAICEREECREETVLSSWLPLSHDLGLVGIVLVGWRCGGNSRVSQPERFATRPLSWLHDISDDKASISAAPNFALELVLKALPRAKDPGWDLSSLRCLVIGGEVIRPETLRRFTAALEPYGLSPDALAPAYGMAEAALAVSLTAPGEPWRVCHVDAASIESGAVRVIGESVPGLDCSTVAEGVVEVVVSGRVLDGYVVLTDDDSNIFVDGPSVTSGYLGMAPRVGMHPTRDVGAVTEAGEVLVLGRSDEIIVVRGRNLHPLDAEHACDGLVRRGAVAAVPDGEGGLALICEPQGETGEERAQEVRRRVVQATGVGPSRVVFVKRGTLWKTTSGKTKRRALHAALVGGTLKIVEDHRFGGARGRFREGLMGEGTV